VARSNWALMAFDHNADSCDGTIEGLQGLCSAEIVKDFIYIRSGDRHIASVYSGDVSIEDLHIDAKRATPQGGVFTLITSSLYVEGEGTKTKRMAGVGVYGYDDHVDEMIKHFGIDESEWDDFAITSSYGPDHDDYGLYVSADRDGKYVGKNFMLPRGEAKRLGFVDSTWVGVTPETYQEFLKWLEDLPTYDDSYPEWVAKIKASKARQFNAGDAYFLGTQAAMDRHGEAPVIDTMINALKDSPRD